MRGTSLVAQWLRLYTPTARGLSLTPDEGIRSGAAQKKKKKILKLMRLLKPLKTRVINYNI